jgi:hypothetical protein
MMSGQSINPTRVEVAATKVEPVLDLPKILGSIARATAATAAAAGGDQPSPEVAEHLRNISRLAQELASEMTAVATLDPSIEQRIEKVVPPEQHHFGRAR